MNLVLVVARYKESTEWTKNIKNKVLIFNKNIEENNLFELNLPNKGFETDTFLYFIIENYESLPDYIAFLQGNPFDHCPEVLKLINYFKFDSSFVPLGPIYIRDGSVVEETIKWAEFCNINVNLPIKFIGGAQCIVSKDLIKQRTKKSYIYIHEKVCPHIDFNSHTKYFFEYLWPTILGFNDKI
jgi:hypothetical protein